MTTNPEDFGIPMVGTPGGLQAIPSSFIRENNVSAYAQYDLLAASTTAATAVEIVGAVRAAGEAFRWEGVRLRSTNPLAKGKTFRVHLFAGAPTLGVNDNGVFNASGANVLAVSDIAGYVGYVDVTLDMAGTAGAAGRGGLDYQQTIVPTTGTSLWWVLEQRDAAGYTPIAQEQFHARFMGQWS